MVDILILFQDDAEDLATRIAWAAAERGYSVWGDPNHFAAAPDEEIDAAARGARAVALLWSEGLVAEARKREEAFASIDPRRAAAAMVQLGLEPPSPWRERDNLDLSRAAEEPAAVETFIGELARAAGAPSGGGGESAVDRLRIAEEEAASWRAIRDLDSPEVFEAYLNRFGKKGLFASLARKRRAAARASRLASGGEQGVAPLAADGKRGALIYAGGGALAATALFGVLALATGGDLRKLTGGPTEDVLALQNAAEYSADLGRELAETHEALESAQEALKARNLAVAQLEIALAEARGGDEGEGAPAAAPGSRLIEMAERQAALEQELARKEQALALATDRLTEAEQELVAARSKVDALRDDGGAALAEELEASRTETRRANRILEAARLRIEALEAERAALRAEMEKGAQAEQGAPAEQGAEERQPEAEPAGNAGERSSLEPANSAPGESAAGQPRALAEASDESGTEAVDQASVSAGRAGAGVDDDAAEPAIAAADETRQEDPLLEAASSRLDPAAAASGSASATAAAFSAAPEAAPPPRPRPDR